jgi:hypothetical protein
MTRWLEGDAGAVKPEMPPRHPACRAFRDNGPARCAASLP